MRLGSRGHAVLTALIIAGCAKTSAPAPERPAGGVAGSAYRECTDPRPALCLQQYLPVCAVRDTGIRCVTTPCDSSELKTYANACMACSDPSVYGHTEGVCRPTPGEPTR